MIREVRVTTMSHETRRVRPFLIQRDLDQCLASVRVRLGAMQIEPDSRIVVNDSDEYLRSPVALSWAKDKVALNAFTSRLVSNLEAESIPLDAVALVAIAYTRYLKISNILVNCPLNEIDTFQCEHVFHGSDRPKALKASTHGATITVYLVLRRNIRRKPLRPWRKGTWLSKRSFEIHTNTPHQLFRPIPLDEDKRVEMRLSKQCVHFLDMGEHNPLETYSASHPPSFYVDKDLLAHLDRAAQDPVSCALQAQLARDFLAEVTLEIAREHDNRAAPPPWTDLRKTLFGRIIAMIVREEGSSRNARDEAIALAFGDPVRFLARLEHTLNLRRLFNDALEREE